MIPRILEKELLTQLREYPVVTVLGPRQAGKTTLVRTALPEHAYVSLEDPENRLIASEDPRAFLKAYPGDTIFDEIQRVPQLLSYLQGIVDAEKRNGRFVLTGSHQLELRAAIIFENLVVVEALKARYNCGLAANLYFFRDSHGNEIDLLHKSGSQMLGMEIKAAATWHPGFKTALNRFSEKVHPLQKKYVAYRGRPISFEDGVQAIPYEGCADVFA